MCERFVTKSFEEVQQSSQHIFIPENTKRAAGVDMGHRRVTSHSLRATSLLYFLTFLFFSSKDCVNFLQVF